MKIGIIGFGAIAQRVYLPLYLNNTVIKEIHVCTRNKDKLQSKLSNYNFYLYDDFIQMLKNIDCLMVHSATVAHYEYIKIALEKHVPVYVDKPLSDDIEKSHILMKLAKESNTLLFVGYNRRHAPLYKQVKAMKLKPYMIYYEKHRASLTQNEDYTAAIIDDFIHLVDTVVDFNQKDLKVNNANINITPKNELVSLYVDLSSDKIINTLFTTRGSSYDYEKVTIYCSDQIVTIKDMRVLTILKDDIETIIKVNERLSDSQVRGFENTVNTFFTKVKTNNFSESRQIISEEICLDIIDYIKATK